MKADGSKRAEPWKDGGEKVIVDDRSYERIRLLGHGKGGYSYLVWDGETH